MTLVDQNGRNINAAAVAAHDRRAFDIERSLGEDICECGRYGDFLWKGKLCECGRIVGQKERPTASPKLPR